jgi:hypothetical protein
MNQEFCRKAPLLRFGLAVAAMLVTILIGGFVDVLATEQVAAVADALYGPVHVASR